jgi:ribosomal protein RSM22 (predicted rRNA methylase)
MHEEKSMRRKSEFHTNPVSFGAQDHVNLIYITLKLCKRKIQYG